MSSKTYNIAEIHEKLTHKGDFKHDSKRGANHNVYTYQTYLNGNGIKFSTMLPRGRKSKDVNKTLLNLVAKQCHNLPLKKMKAFMECSFSPEDFEAHVKRSVQL